MDSSDSYFSITKNNALHIWSVPGQDPHVQGDPSEYPSHLSSKHPRQSDIPSESGKIMDLNTMVETITFILQQTCSSKIIMVTVIFAIFASSNAV